MTTYRAISDTEVAVDAPLTQQLMQALKDNEIAVREGDASAPRIDHRAIVEPVVGDFRVYGGTSTYGNLEISGKSASAVGSTHTILRKGTYRFQIRYFKAQTVGSMRATLYQNNAVVHTTGTIGSTTADTSTKELAMNYGDTWKVHLEEINGGISGAGVYVGIGCDQLGAATMGELCRISNLDGSAI